MQILHGSFVDRFWARLTRDGGIGSKDIRRHPRWGKKYCEVALGELEVAGCSLKGARKYSEKSCKGIVHRLPEAPFGAASAGRGGQ